MTQTYVHLTDADLDSAVLRSHGIKIEESSPELPRPKECPRCGEKNTNDARYCRRCWLPLNIEEALKQSQRLEKIESAVQVMGIDEKDKERLGTFGPEAKLELLADLLIEIEKDGQLKDLKKVIAAMGKSSKGE
jgi:ribosomal protein L40E